MTRYGLNIALLLAGTVAAGQVASHVPTKAPIPATASANGASGTPLSAPVARVNGTVLTQRDLLRQMMNDFPYARQHGGHFPKEIEADLRKEALKQIEFDELVYQEARRRGMSVSPAKLAKAVAEFKKQFSSTAQYREYLRAEQGGSAQKLRTAIERAILIDTLVTSETMRKSKLTEVQVRTFYDKNQERFRKPESVSMRPPRTSRRFASTRKSC
jgi:parvulin-like peptidyl-prolyl isomerase